MNYVEEIFGNQEEELLNKNKDRIISFLSSLNEELILEDYELNYEDAKEREEDPTYLQKADIKIEGNKIKFLHLNKKTLDFIKKYCPKTIKKITISQGALNKDLSFIFDLNSLEEIRITKGFSLFPEDIKSIKEKTNIKLITVDVLPYIISTEYLKPGFYISESKNAIYYQGLLIKDKRNIMHNSFTIETIDDLNLEMIASFLNTLDYNKEELTVKTPKISYTIAPNNSGYSIRVYSIDPKDAVKIYENYKSKYDISDLAYYITGVDYLNINIDSLKGLKDVRVSINYGEPVNTSISGFESLQSTIGYYKSLIGDFDLSPVEKLMYAYDIMKTFKYNEGEKIYDSRFAANIIQSGHIVCGGYAQMMIEIMRNTPGIKIEYQTVSNYDKDGKYKGGHARNIVRVDDEKYNIHGIYILDSTWDSDKSLNQIGEDKYTSLDLYNFFLIPYREYENVFPNDTLPSIMQEYYNSKRGLPNSFMKEVKLLFDKDISENEITNYMNANRLPLEELLKIIYNIRLAEGYTKQEAQKELERIERINSSTEKKYNKENEVIVDYFGKKSV